MEEISKWFLIMNYGNYYKEVSFNKQSINVVRKEHITRFKIY